MTRSQRRKLSIIRLYANERSLNLSPSPLTLTARSAETASVLSTTSVTSWQIVADRASPEIPCPTDTCLSLRSPLHGSQDNLSLINHRKTSETVSRYNDHTTWARYLLSPCTFALEGLTPPHHPTPRKFITDTAIKTACLLRGSSELRVVSVTLASLLFFSCQLPRLTSPNIRFASLGARAMSGAGADASSPGASCGLLGSAVGPSVPRLWLLLSPVVRHPSPLAHVGSNLERRARKAFLLDHIPRIPAYPAYSGAFSHGFHYHNKRGALVGAVLVAIYQSG